MNSLFSKLIVAFVLLIPATAFAQHEQSVQKLDGFWIFHANLPPQAGAGGSAGGPGYAGSARFLPDGTLAGSPVDQHSGPLFGEWVRTGYHEFAFTFVSDAYDGSGNYLNTNRVRGTMTVSDDGLTATGRTLLEILDKTGKISFTAPAQTTFTGTRLIILSL
jgi:hypothetical protein